ncbi:ABC transporter ATP-binding protein [Domibacillus mangrovi]|uniref:ABC transporter permease n=1 Tax=Domibacillus mangrovi TaxID=1714354 RepID=A0A1Q5P2U4_9BACI|nr:ABC transporter ATP-binding protein [Domibacillus mangrovi]OKL36580.1 ABC transporter permease [Domibacillus mangrovi]
MNIRKMVDKWNFKQYLSTKDMEKIFFLLLPYVKKHKKAYIGLFFLLFVDIAITLASAWFVGNIMDAALQSNFGRLKWLVLAGIGLSMISITSNFINIYLDTVAVNAVKKDLNLNLYEHILLLPGKSLSSLHSGELLSHFTNDIHSLDGVIGSGLMNLIRFPIISIAAFVYLIQINWKLSLLSLSVAPIAIAGGAVFGLLLRNNSRLIHELISSITKSLTDTFHGFTVIRSFTLEKLLYSKYAQKNQALYSLELKDAKLRGWFYAGGEAVGSITFLISLIIGAYFVMDNIITIGALLTFINLVNHLIYPLTGLAGQWAGYQNSISALERITNLFNQLGESKELPSYFASKTIDHTIQFQDITFSYDGKRNVFENFQLQIPAGKVVAIVGPSGAGKSTLFNLLQRFYEPQAGSILIDDASINDLTISELRNSIAYVPQETFLFSGTIRENLLLARPGITEEEMIQGAANANIHEYITSLPEGYDTEIGERGIKLSGGQRQRISIARAILKDASILLLDEATSALDSESEFLVKEALDRLMKNRTTLIIAHRLSTIQHAEVIAVMEKGKIVQIGKHEELINQKGLYQELHKNHFTQDKYETTLSPVHC